MNWGLTVASELDFDAEEWAAMSPQKRIRRCLLFAEQARALSVSGPPESGQAYEHLSRQWLALANEIERSSDDPERPSSHAD